MRLQESDVSTTNDPPHPPYDESDPAFALHRGGKMETVSTVPLRDREDLSLAYTPGVARVCTAIAEHPELVYDLTWKSNVVAVVTDGSAVLGLGDIGPAAALPVMEGKAVLFKQFGGVDAVPICLDATTVQRERRVGLVVRRVRSVVRRGHVALLQPHRVSLSHRR